MRADGAISYRKIELRPDAQRLAPTTPLSYIDEQVKGNTPANVIFTGLLPENPHGGTVYDGRTFFPGFSGGNLYIDTDLSGDDVRFTFKQNPTPEPSTMVMLAGGAALLPAWWRRRRRAAR